MTAKEVTQYVHQKLEAKRAKMEEAHQARLEKKLSEFEAKMKTKGENDLKRAALRKELEDLRGQKRELTAKIKEKRTDLRSLKPTRNKKKDKVVKKAA